MNALKFVHTVLAPASAAAFTLLSIMSFAQATPPGRINYQGVVRDAAGSPLDGPVTMTLRFYDAASAGTLLWEETYSATYPPQVTVSSGLFTVALGDAAHRIAGSEALFPNVFAQHAGVYLAVAVGLDAEMTPRIQVVSAPFAVSAARLEGRKASSFANTSHVHVDADIPDTITVSNYLPLEGGTMAGNVAFSGAQTVDGVDLSAGALNWDAAYTHASDTTGAVHGATSANTANMLVRRDANGDFTGRNLTASYFNCSADVQTANPAYIMGVWGDNYLRKVAPANVSVGSATNADTLDSQHAAYFLNTSSAAQTKAAKLLLNSATDYGIASYGATAGGYFEDSTATGYARVAFGNYGISAYGSVAGGDFNDTDSSGYAQLGYDDWGIYAGGSNSGGYFEDSDSTGYARVGWGDYGITASGNMMGGNFSDLTSSTYCRAGYDTYKVYSNGTASFVQNHPTEKDKVIVYASPEGDEVATYSRGSAKLVNGEARVKLGETFQWVTNPDIGLTAHLTARGRAVPLAVTSLSTTELVVTGPEDAAFDYLVYGLRIGFEESSIVQEKHQEAYIPSFNNHRERYAKYPQLRAFNALERFTAMESSIRSAPESSLDLSRARALKEAIHEYDPTTDPPAEKLLGYGPGKPEPLTHRSEPSAQPGNSPVAAAPRLAESASPAFAQSVESEAGATSVLQPRSIFPCLPVSEAVEPGDVVVMDSVNEKHVARCAALADPLVVGIAAGRGEECTKLAQEDASSQVPVATSGIVPCKVDAAFGSIRRGDLLVASPNPGHAMRADNPSQGTVLGKALEPLVTGTGLIKVLVMLR